MKTHIVSSSRAVLVAALVASLMAANQSHASRLSRVVNNTAKTVHKAVKDTGKTLEKAGRDTGRTSDKAYKDTAKEVGRHPGEYAAAAAFVTAALCGVLTSRCAVPISD